MQEPAHIKEAWILHLDYQLDTAKLVISDMLMKSVGNRLPKKLPTEAQSGHQHNAH